MKGWTEQRISDVYEALFDGPHATPAPTNEGKIFLRIENITEDGRLDFSNPTFISNEEFPRWTRRVTPRVGDVVFSYEATLGRYAIIPKGFDGCLGRRIALIRPNQKKINPKFLLYYFFGYAWQHEINNYLVTGSTVDRIPLIKFPRFKILTPPLPIQRKIAAVLSAYDDLIENNNRRISLLEKMGEELYREWFVRLRFPGHESTKIVKGVPEGWILQNCHSILDIMGGGTPRTDVSGFWDGDIPFFTPKDSHEGYFSFETEKWLTESGLQSCNSPLYPKGTIFITARGTVGNIVFAGRAMAMNQSCYALFPKNKRFPQFHFLALRNTVAVIRGTANSGVFDNIITDSFKQFGYLVPADDLLHDFETHANPIFSQIEKLIKSSSILGLSRDRLLTRLMSGKIDLETLDIAFPPSMQEAA